jgi:hypothetical protein
MIAKALKVRDGSISSRNGTFRQLCFDILASESTRVGSKSQSARVKEVVGQLVDRYCGEVVLNVKKNKANGILV